MLRILFAGRDGMENLPIYCETAFEHRTIFVVSQLIT